MRKFYPLAFCIILTLLTGCAASTKEAAGPSSSTSPAVEEINVPDAPSDEQHVPDDSNGDQGDQPATEYTVAEICAGFRAEEEGWGERYETPSIFWVTIDGEDYYYWQTYLSNMWNASEVANYYREHKALWGNDPTVSYGKCTKFYLWTPDYEHQFVADTAENWLYIDGVEAAPLASTAYSMNPKDLVEAFQTKEWDGTTRRYSEDFSTYVTVVPERGVLEYEFHTQYLSKEKDPAGVAYTGYLDAIPWWEDETNNYDTIVMCPSDYTSAAEGLKVPSHYSWREHDDSGDSGGYTSHAWAIAYADVPWEQQGRLWAVRSADEVYPDSSFGEHAMHAFYAGRTADGLYAIVDEGVELWRAGRLRQTWSLKMTDDSYISTNQYYSDSILVYTNGKLYELFDDGEVEVVVDDLVSVNLEYADTFCGFTLSQDGMLQICGIRGNNGIISKEIATNVVAADLSNDRLVLYTDTTGKTYAIYDFLGTDAGMVILCEGGDYKVACLGEGSIEHFKELFETRSSDYTYSPFQGDKLPQEQFIEETSAAYLTSISEN